MNEILKPANIISYIFGIVGIIFSLYTYLMTKENKEISYHLNSNTFEIYNPKLLNSNSKLKLFVNDTSRINEPVYLTTLSFWNSGNSPISPNDVRKGIELKLKGTKKILDYSIIKAIDGEVALFELRKVTNNIFNIKWKYFDPKCGLKFQIIYTGEKQIDVDVDGKVLGIERFNKYLTSQDIRNRKGDFTDYFIIFMIVGLVMCIVDLLR